LIVSLRELPGRVIVGFSIWGFYAQFKNDPGNIQESINQNRPQPGTPRISPWGAYAKWAFKNAIVRLPMDEQNASASAAPTRAARVTRVSVIDVCM